MSRGSVSGGRVAAMCGARASRQAAGHHGKTRAQLGLVEPLPDRFVPVPAAEAVLSLSVPAAAVHDGRICFNVCVFGGKHLLFVKV